MKIDFEGCVCAYTCVQVPEEATRGRWIPWNWDRVAVRHSL